MSLADHRPPRFSMPRIAVIGGGVVGLACALELTRRGAVVHVYERGGPPGDGATARAAGMLGLAYEAPEYASQAMRSLALRSFMLWPELAAEFHEIADGGCNFRADGTIAVALNADDTRRLQAIAMECQAMQLPYEEIDGPASKEEPALADSVIGGLRLKTDMQVDPRLLVARLAIAVERLGSAVSYNTPIDLVICGRRFGTPDGQEWDQVLLATGVADAPAFATIDGTPCDLRLPAIEPVKGQMLALQAVVGAPRYVVRAGSLYIVPKQAWTLVGGVSEPGKTDRVVDRDIIDRLREQATRLLPGLAVAQEVDAWVGIRPKTADGAPVLGETALKDVFVAGGHYRNGVLLAPASAEFIAELMLDRKMRAGGENLSPLRFDRRVEPSHSP